MASVPPPPPGFDLDSAPSAASATPPPPPGFELDQAPQSAQGTTPVESPGVLDTVGHLVNQASAGINKGVLSTAGPFMDVAAYPARAIQQGLDYISGTNAAQPPPSQVLKSLFVDSADAPQNGLDNVLQAGGEMAGANMLPTAAIGGLAGSGVRAAETAAPSVWNTIKSAGNAVLDWVAEHPTKAALTSETGAFQSGAGGQLARGAAGEAGYGPEGQQNAEFLGQMLTPLAVEQYMHISPTALIAKGVMKGAEKAIGYIPNGSSADRAADSLAYANREGQYTDPNVPSPDAPTPGVLGPVKDAITSIQDAGAAQRTQKAQNVVGQEFNQVLQRPEAGTNLAETEGLQKDIPGFAPGIAKATGDPALLNLQQKIEGQSVGPELRDAQAQTDNSAQSIRQYLESIVPPVEASKPPDFVGPMQAAENPQDIVAKSVADRVKGDTAAVGQQVADTQNKIQGISDSLPETDRIAQGGALRDARTAAQQAMDAKTTALRNQIAEPDKVVIPATDTAPAQTVNNLLDRRAAINQEMRDYTNATARTVDDVKRMRGLQAERDNIDSVINDNADKIGGLSAYTNQYRTENVPQFRQGASAEVGRQDSFGYGGNRVDPEQVAGKFFNPNEESAAKQFDASMGHDPAARQQMVDHALDDIRQKGTDPTTGLIKEGFVDKWLQKNSRVLAQMPQTGPEIRAAVSSKNPDALYQRMGDLEQRQRAIADTKVAGLLGKNPEQHIDAALNDWQVMRTLKRSVAGDPQGEAALQRAVWERASAAGGKDTLLDPVAMQKWIDGHKRALGEVLTPDHLASLQKVIKAATIEGRLPRPKGAVDQPGTLADRTAGKTGISVTGMLSRAYNVAKGYTSPLYAATDIGLRAWHHVSGAEIDAAWREALSNPKVAQNLAMVSGGKPTAIQMKRLKTYLLTAGVVDTNSEAKTGDLPHQ